MRNVLKKTIEYLFYLFVFVFIFQAKLIIIPAETNYNEIALYFNYLLLAFILVLFFLYIIKYNKEEFKKEFDFGKYWIILLGLEFFIFISIFLSSIKNVSIFKYILFLLVIGLLFVMTNFKFNYKKIIIIFLSAIFVQASIGLFQFFSQQSFSNKYLGIASHDASVLGVSVLEGDMGRFVRAYGATDHPNIFGALMFFGIIILILLVLKNNYQGYRKILAYLMLSVFLLALITSFSRSAILALGISYLFLFFVFLFKKNKTNFKKYYQIFVFSFLFCSLFFIILKPLILDRFNLDSRLEKISINERSQQILMSSKIIKNDFWLGVGVGSYHNELLNLNPHLKPYQAQPVHNSFLLILSEVGFWGFISFIWFILHIFKKNIIHFKHYPIFIGLFVFLLLDHWLFSLPFGILFMFFVISLTFYLKYDII